LPAWFAWRGIYLAKLPSFGDKALVLLDWFTDLFAPVDVAQIPLGKARGMYLPAGAPSTETQSAQPAGTPS
jgi:hypothetical protein